MDDFGLPTPVTPPTPPPVPQPETPVIIPPKKKFPAMAVAGALSLMLLIGGVVYLSRQLVQQRQVAEQQAEEGPCSESGASCNYPPGFSSCGEWECAQKEGCKWTSGNRCQRDEGPRKCPNGQPKICSDPPEYSCVNCGGANWTPNSVKQCILDNWPSKPAGVCSPGVIKFQQCSCDLASPSPTPSPSPDVSPGPSPSPVVGLACVDLTKDTAAPKVGDAVTFTCESSAATGMSPVAFFRYSTDNGVNFSGAVPVAGIGVNPTTHKASYDITIDKTGDWEVQCRVCTDSSAASCTDWGQALTTLTH